jgi:hypothetical protein
MSAPVPDRRSSSEMFPERPPSSITLAGQTQAREVDDVGRGKHRSLVDEIEWQP